MTAPRPTVLVVGVSGADSGPVVEALDRLGYEAATVGSVDEAASAADVSPAPVAAVAGDVAGADLGRVGVPVVALAATPAAIDEALDRGAHDVVRTPVDPAELGARVRAAERVGRLEAAVRNATCRDPLTGLSTRAHVEEHLETMAMMARRLRAPFSVLVVDIDRIGRINDEFGTGAGDAVTMAVAHRVADGLRGEDVAGRSDGADFVVLLSHTPVDGAWRLADRIRASVCEKPILLGDGNDVVVTVSIGCAEGSGQDGDDHLRRARAALAEAKAMGRNRVIASA